MMQTRSAKWLSDVCEACSFIKEVAGTVARERFAEDCLVRYAVERNFEIIGEALLRLERNDPALVTQISNYRAVIGLRNRLVHGYDDIDTHRLWHIINRDLPGLRTEVTSLLAERDGQPPTCSPT